MTPRFVTLRTTPWSLAATLALLIAPSACSGPDATDGVAGAPATTAGTSAGMAGGPTNTGGSGAGMAGSSATAGDTGTAGSSAGSASAGGAGGNSGGAGGSGGAGLGGFAGAAGAAGSPAIDHNASGVIVVLGSSTSAGTGPKDPANAWVERYRAYLKTEFPNFKLTNLAVGGYTTYQMQPSDFTPPGGRPQPDKNHNITLALTLKPNAIIINMPSNDANSNYAAADQMANFDRVTQLATQNGVMSWVTTTQPRNFNGDSAQTQATKWSLQISVRDAIQQKYGDHTLDFWTQFAEPGGKIKAMWDAGDGTHMNDAAHALLVQEVIDAKIPEAAIAAQP